MKVLAINSSQRHPSQSVTATMLDQLVEGMTEAGAEVDLISLRGKKIKSCRGCYTCMTETPGKCVIHDVMTEELFPMWLRADVVTYATPLFHHLMNAPMKNFIERTYPICTPFFREKRSGRWNNPIRAKYPAAVVLAVGGYLDESAFSVLSHYANYLWGKSLIAEIYRPAAEFLIPMPGEKVADVLCATKQAGKEIVENLKVSDETLASITQPLSDIDTLLESHNLFWKTCIDNAITPGTFGKRGMTVSPDLKMKS
ncbi:flavodoxin family protein [Chloroflexota bacterium]